MPIHTTDLSIPDLRDQLTGRVIAPGDDGYDAARGAYTSAIDRRPAVIVQAAGADDVARVVDLARETGSELAVRGGGHSIPGHSTTEGGILLDMSAVRQLDIDPEQRTAWAGAGLTAGEYTAAAGAHGLATGFGDTASVGIGGLTLGGGIGYLVRKHGLTVDHLLAADVVTAGGELVRADAEQHPDLFWALRGGGGNFGVVTRFQFRLHPVDTIVGGMLLLPATADVIAAFVAAADAAPEELTTIANIMVAPPAPFIPPEHHGTLLMMVLLAYAGPVADGEAAVAPFRALATPIADMIRPMPYPDLYQFTADGPKPVRESARTVFRDTFDRGTAEAILERMRAVTAPIAVTQLRVLGGAMARVPAEATAYAHRDRRIMVAAGTVYDRADEVATHEAWASEFADAMREGEPGAYVNFLGDEGEQRIRQAYPGATWDRLAEIKARYDPTNLFHRNQNIAPATR